MKIIAYTDGACSGNKRGACCPGGIGVVILVDGDEAGSFGSHFNNTTNNRMEMQAVVTAIEMIHNYASYHKIKKSEIDLEIKTDSRYVCDNYTDYLQLWKKNNWRKSNGKPVLNVDLWKEIDGLIPEFKSFSFKWIKGHDVDEFNNKADKIATDYVRDY